MILAVLTNGLIYFIFSKLKFIQMLTNKSINIKHMQS